MGKGGKTLVQIYHQFFHNPGFHELQAFLGRSPWLIFGFLEIPCLQVLVGILNFPVCVCLHCMGVRSASSPW